MPNTDSGCQKYLLNNLFDPLLRDIFNIINNALVNTFAVNSSIGIRKWQK